MKKVFFALSLLAWAAGLQADPAYGFESDVFDTSAGQVRITFIGHGTLMIDFGAIVIHVDPVSREADYSKLPKADIILITHEHRDHFDRKAVDLISKPGTEIIMNPSVGQMNIDGIILKNGESASVQGIYVQAVPAYNTTEGRSRFHPEGRDNGYIINPGGLLIYIAGDTEVIPEMAAFKNIDIAFLPVNQPYTMTVRQAEEAALLFKPKVLYPYHYNDTDVYQIVAGLKGSGIEVRIRDLE